MARRVNLKVFYAVLAVLVVAGGAVLWSARRGEAGAVVTPTPVSADAFDGYVMGSDSAPVTVIQYSNFECGWCARFAILAMPDVRTHLIDSGVVEWKFRDFPLPGHEAGDEAHLAAACVAEQGDFWQMHDQLFFNQGRWAEESHPERTFRDYARALGVNLGQYDQCMKQRRYVARIQATRDAGAALGVNATPTFIINGKMYPTYMDFDAFRSVVEKARAQATRNGR